MDSARPPCPHCGQPACSAISCAAEAGTPEAAARLLAASVLEPEPEPEVEPEPRAKPARRAPRATVPIPVNAQTSDTHPIRVSWVTAAPEDGDSVAESARLGLCFCPGKQIVKSRLRAGHEESGRPIMRDLAQDLARLHGLGIRQLVCLLNDAELRSLGIKQKYGEEVAKAGIEFVHYPIVEGAGAQDHVGTMEAAHLVVVGAASVLQRGESAVLHCRGGVGRAGMMAACLLLLMGEAKSPQEAIALIRKRRCKQAVETRRQEDFVKRYHAWLIETGIIAAPPQQLALLAAADAAGVAAAATGGRAQRVAVVARRPTDPKECQRQRELQRQQVKERREAANEANRAAAAAAGARSAAGGAGAGAGAGDGGCTRTAGCTCPQCDMSVAMLSTG